MNWPLDAARRKNVTKVCLINYDLINNKIKT